MESERDLKKQKIKDLDKCLMLACSDGDLCKIKKLINCGANVNSNKYRWNSTPLMIAVMHDNREIIDYLLTCKEIDINKKDKDGENVLGYVDSCRIHVFKQLLSIKGINVNIIDKNGWSCLSNVLYAGKYEYARMLISKGANVNKAIEILKRNDIEVDLQCTYILKDWKQYLPPWSEQTHKYYPKEFKELVITWLMCVKRIKHKKAFCKDIRTYMCKFLAVNFKLK